MPLFTLAVVVEGRTLREEGLRAADDAQARAQAQLRFSRCAAGETLILSFEGVECDRLGPRRAR